MSGKDRIEEFAKESATDEAVALLQSLVTGPSRAANGLTGPVIGEVVALADGGQVPLVVYSGQPGTAAIRARTTVDLHAVHIGRPAVLIFENGNPARPIVVGVIRRAAGWPLDDRPGEIEVDADGARLVVTAKEQVVLRCGKASITLTKAGKVLLQGTYVSTRSSGLNRIKGGSVEIN